MRHRSENSGSTPGFEAPSLILGQLGKGGKWPRIRLGVLRRLENGIRLSRIGIKPEDQELGGERAQIDDPARSTAPDRPI